VSETIVYRAISFHIFSQSVLLMYGNNQLFQLILDHYYRLCIVSAVLTYLPT